MSLISRVDAVVADLTTLAGLPAPAAVRRYQRPQIVTPALCPMLAVFPKESDPELLATDSSYQGEDDLVVAWFENAADSLQSGQWDENAAKTALTRASTIIARLETYGAGIAGYSAEATECTLGKIRYGHMEGGIWATEISLKVTSWAN